MPFSKLHVIDRIKCGHLKPLESISSYTLWEQLREFILEKLTRGSMSCHQQHETCYPLFIFPWIRIFVLLIPFLPYHWGPWAPDHPTLSQVRVVTLVYLLSSWASGIQVGILDTKNISPCPYSAIAVLIYPVTKINCHIFTIFSLHTICTHSPHVPVLICKSMRFCRHLLVEMFFGNHDLHTCIVHKKRWCPKS